METLPIVITPDGKTLVDDSGEARPLCHELAEQRRIFGFGDPAADWRCPMSNGRPNVVVSVPGSTQSPVLASFRRDTNCHAAH